MESWVLFRVISLIREQWKFCIILFKVWCEVYLSSIKVMITHNIGLLSRKDACGHALSSVWGRQWLFSFFVKFIANNCLIIYCGFSKQLFPSSSHFVSHLSTFLIQKCRIWLKDILKMVNLFFMKIGGKKHHGKINKRGKFQLNLVHGFLENNHHHLQPIYIFLEIRDVGFSDVWCGDELG